MSQLFDVQRALSRNAVRSLAPWYLSLAAAGLLTWNGGAFAEEELTPPQPPPVNFVIQDPTQPPVLPDTNVEAQPPQLPDTTVQGQQPVYPDAFQDGNLTGTILDGTIFSNTPAIGYRAETSTAGSIIAIPDA